MIPWWVSAITFMCGGIVGVIFAALLTANERDDRP